jgi:2-polyprenyl-3-methyl-5-hydroxy-6-metoxy-1,4-benzoquinol methylase
MKRANLSEKEYWDKVLADAQLPRLNSKKNYSYSVTMKFIHEVIFNKSYKTFLEVGCGSSGWLPYFATKYDFVVSGLDYSEIGCKLALKNLQMQNIDFDEIICKDILESKVTNGKKYDIVFSYGVIEHFNNPQEIIKIFYDLVNTNGIIITLIPNLNGFPGLISRIFVKDIYLMHKVISKSQLRSYHETNGFVSIKSNYAGIFSLAVIPWVRSKVLVFKGDNLLRKFALKLIFYFDFLLSAIFKFIRIDMPSELFSPYVICIAKKGSVQ